MDSRLADCAITKEIVISDYTLAVTSRQASLVGRREVMAGKAKFGIFGDGKEVAQVALAKAFRPGDWRSGYYRDQTMMFALGRSSVLEFFAQLYADPDIDHDPASAGRQMNAHFATRFIDRDGAWLDQTGTYNSSADASPTACQMARLLGLGYASKLYRDSAEMGKAGRQFSNAGSEVAFGTIGNASTAEGIFWECFNAAGVLQVPIVFSVWDDGYGISVPNKYQMTKESVSEIVAGFVPSADKPGIDVYIERGWDYAGLVSGYIQGVEKTRKQHTPCLFHIVEMTQPQGHSTSGSHERYKSQERLAYEQDIDCISRMRAWMIEDGIASSIQLDDIEGQCAAEVEAKKEEAWERCQDPIRRDRDQMVKVFQDCASQGVMSDDFSRLTLELQNAPALGRRTIAALGRRALRRAIDKGHGSEPTVDVLRRYVDQHQEHNQKLYSRFLYSEGARSALEVPVVAKGQADSAQTMMGFEVLNRYFRKVLTRDPRLFFLGEDVGKIGDVNQGLKGLQADFGEHRVTDTGIREATILGQGIGAAMRGLRPIVEIQYLDYLLYCFQVMSDDLATLHYRTAGGQRAPVIVRTRGHRLEGIWHTGSPMGMIVHGLRGIHVCVPRNMVQAAGMYNTLLASDDPGLVIEVLNGYRLRETPPANLGDYNIPLGVPEVLRRGSDVTIATYGACTRIAVEAAQMLADTGIDCEVIDVQTLLPFDTRHIIGSSIEKTNAALFLDEDVPGGATAFMLQQVIEKQRGYECLDAPPRTLCAQEHRSAYGSDGDYWSKPNAEDVVDVVYEIMHERYPMRFPQL